MIYLRVLLVNLLEKRGNFPLLQLQHFDSKQ